MHVSSNPRTPASKLKSVITRNTNLSMKRRVMVSRHHFMAYFIDTIMIVLNKGQSCNHKGHMHSSFPQISQCMSFTLTSKGHIILCRPRKGEQVHSVRRLPLKEIVQKYELIPPKTLSTFGRTARTTSGSKQKFQHHTRVAHLGYGAPITPPLGTPSRSNSIS